MKNKNNKCWSSASYTARLESGIFDSKSDENVGGQLRRLILYDSRMETLYVWTEYDELDPESLKRGMKTQCRWMASLGHISEIMDMCSVWLGLSLLASNRKKSRTCRHTVRSLGLISAVFVLDSIAEKDDPVFFLAHYQNTKPAIILGVRWDWNNGQLGEFRVLAEDHITSNVLRIEPAERFSRPMERTLCLFIVSSRD